jgi:hypothetical protein
MASPEPKNMLVSTSEIPKRGIRNGATEMLMVITTPCDDQEVRIEVVALVGNFTALVSDRWNP